MDPNQVAAAGVQHDDLGDTTTSADGGWGGGGSDDSWARALLRRGWDLSRKAAIAGIAAMAAPVVAPPLMVLSIAGVALSLPFAAYLASLAATDRLMAALLLPPRILPYHTCDLEDDEFLDASEAPGGEAPVFNYWSETEDDAIMEENESYASLPLSREPRLAEEPVPLLNDEEDTMSEGEFRFQELGQESFVLDIRAQKEEDNEYITMEALPPRGFDDSRLAAPELCEEVNMIPRIIEAPVAAEKPVQELSASDNADKIEDRKRTATEEMESSKEMVSLGVDIDTTEVSDFPVPILGKDDIVVQREGEWEVSVRKSGQDSLVSDVGDKTEEIPSIVSEKTEEMPPQEVSVSESSVLDDNTLVIGTTDLVTGEVVGVQVDIIASGSEALPLSDLMAQELQAVTEATIVDDIQASAVTGDIVKDIDDANTECVEHHSEGGACSFISGASVVTMDDAEGVIPSRSTPYVSATSEDITSVQGRPDVEHPHETTGFEYKLTNEGLKRKVAAEDKGNYTEEQLREQLDTLRTITGYRPATSLTLEAELAGLYIFVGVEPPVSSRDASDLTEINVKLRFLKSIIGVE